MILVQMRHQDTRNIHGIQPRFHQIAMDLKDARFIRKTQTRIQQEHFILRHNHKGLDLHQQTAPGPIRQPVA